MTSAHEKGSALEIAVHAIERAILATAPGYTEKRFRIEMRKIISIGGVHHEVDVWVSVDVAPGYDAIFIFECRNRENKVDKNDIIVFTEKIKAAQAQKGFFAAKSFTSDAEAQASLDPRVRLLHVTDLPLDGVLMPFGIHGLNVEDTHVTFAFAVPGAGSAGVAVDAAAAQWILDGVPADINDYLQTWLTLERERVVNAFPSGAVEARVHTLPLEAERQFEAGRARLNGLDVEKILLRGHVRVRITRPTLVSFFDVATRGRALTARIEIGGEQATVAIVFENPDEAPRRS